MEKEKKKKVKANVSEGANYFHQVTQSSPHLSAVRQASYLLPSVKNVQAVDRRLALTENKQFPIIQDDTSKMRRENMTEFASKIL